jgi:hypothetical protein
MQFERFGVREEIGLDGVAKSAKCKLGQARAVRAFLTQLGVAGLGEPTINTMRQEILPSEVIAKPEELAAAELPWNVGVVSHKTNAAMVLTMLGYKDPKIFMDCVKAIVEQFVDAYPVLSVPASPEGLVLAAAKWHQDLWAKCLAEG